ncbi:MAG: hypothetical protein DME76_14200 [Verrucomicrobia bacterium]|nr:MAG: hypothetical protein DME76_14200 [Verrucomicrobiota bacterium]
MRSDDSALLIVAHGSTVNPDSSTPTLAHAAEIRRRKFFADVGCAFWKEEPSLRDALLCSISNQVVKLTSSRISSMEVFGNAKACSDQIATAHNKWRTQLTACK